MARSSRRPTAAQRRAAAQHIAGVALILACMVFGAGFIGLTFAVGAPVFSLLTLGSGAAIMVGGTSAAVAFAWGAAL